MLRQSGEMGVSELFSVRDKTVLVTGGSRGIGQMIARTFVEAGARVCIAARNSAEAEATAKELSELGSCVAVTCDLGGLEGVAALARAASDQFSRLDVLVNNAGTNWVAPIESFPEKGWDKTLDLNLKSVFFLTRELLPLLRAAASADDPARVINIASLNGLIVSDLEIYGYSASKAGLLMLTRQLASRFRHENILVNAIAPGPFETRMMAERLAREGDAIVRAVPLGRLGSPEDIGGASLFLASRASAYITGATIPCDGGGSTIGIS